MKLVMVVFATTALSVFQLVQATITKTAWIANSAMNCVLVDARGQGISLAKEDAMHVISSTFIRMTHRCICVVAGVLCWCAVWSAGVLCDVLWCVCAVSCAGVLCAGVLVVVYQ